jgi:tRNA wybutosine-synthesizing protein 1
MSDYVAALKRQHYQFFGNNSHSAAKLCLWLKKSLKDQGHCYKQAFYGIQSHRCLQMTPNVYCQQRCVFCWRSHEFEPADYLPGKWDEPADIIKGSIAAQRTLLTGFGGLEGVDKQKLKEAQNPNQVAISLAGEPTMYPYLGDLVKEYGRNGFTTFVVSNGLLPERLEALDPLPTQLYVSLDAADQAMQKRTNVPLTKDAWEKLNETLELFPSLDTRKVIRITLVKGINDANPEGYAALIKKSEADFVEVKSFMLVGGARGRNVLTLDNMPLHEETKAFAERINEGLDYEFAGEKKDSRVVLLSSGDKELLIKG